MLSIPDDLNLLEKLQEATTKDVDEEKGSFKKGDKIAYNMLGGGLSNADLMRTVGTAEHILRANHDGAIAEIVEAIGEVVVRYSIMFEDGFAIANLAPSELKVVQATNEAEENLEKMSHEELGNFIDKLTDEIAHEQRYSAGSPELGYMKKKLKKAEELYKKTNEAEDATDTMRPQEKPNLKAEDCGMEDLSDVDLEKAKGSSEDSGNAIRQIDDKELVIEPDKVVEPKKESKLKEQDEDDMSFEEVYAETKSAIKNMRKRVNDWSVRDTLKNFTSWGFWKKGVMASIDTELAGEIADELLSYVEETPQKQDIYDIYDKVYHFVSESKLKEEETAFTPSRAEMKKIGDSQLRTLHKNARRSRDYWKKEGSEPERAISSGQAVEKYEEEMINRGFMSSPSGEKKESYSFMRNREPIWLCNECHMTFRNNNSVCTLCESKEVEKISEQTAGFTKEVFQVTWKNTDTGEEESTRVTAFDKADVRVQFGKKPNKELIKIEGPITEESKEESKVPFDQDSEGVEKEKDKIPGGRASKNKPEDFDPKELEMGINVEKEHTKDPKIAQEIAMDHLKEFPNYYTALKKMEAGLKKNESKLHEGVHELVSNVPGIDKEEQAVLRAAIEDGSISNEWPSEEQIVDALVKAEVDPHIVDDADMEELRRIYLKHILLTKAMQLARVAEAKEFKPITVIEIVRSTIDPEAYNIRVVEIPEGDDIVILDSVSDRDEALSRGKELARVLNAKFIGIIDEKKVDETNVFKLSDEELEKLPLHELGQAREDAWRNYRLGSGSKGGKDWAEAWRRLDRIVKKKMGESKTNEQEEDSFTTIAKGFTDREDADKLAKEKEGQVIQDEEDGTKFAVLVRSTQ